jgi:hypothetical protein
MNHIDRKWNITNAVFRTRHDRHRTPRRRTARSVILNNEILQGMVQAPSCARRAGQRAARPPRSGGRARRPANVRRPCGVLARHNPSHLCRHIPSVACRGLGPPAARAGCRSPRGRGSARLGLTLGFADRAPGRTCRSGSSHFGLAVCRVGGPPEGARHVRGRSRPGRSRQRPWRMA